MASATAMYHSGKNPLKRISRAGGDVPLPKGLKVRRLHKAFLRYHDPQNWPVLREALRRMGRADLIGSGRHHLVPAYQPPGTGEKGGRTAPRAAKARSRERLTRDSGGAGPRPGEPAGRFRTQHTGLPRNPRRPPR